MKKLLIIMILWSLNIFGVTHPNIPLKHLQKKGDAEESFLGDMIEIEKSEIRFEKRNNRYDIFIYDSNGRENLIDSFEEEREILSVFFQEISGDELKEIFMITIFKGEYKIYSYGVGYSGFSYYFRNLNKLDDVLNKHFKNYKNLTASVIKTQIKGQIPLDYASLEYWYLEKNTFYKGIDFLKGEFLGYFDYKGNLVKKSEESDYYLKKYNDNIYGKFDKKESFLLASVFEGYETPQTPYYVKHGKYVYSDGERYSEGSFVNNKKHGNWETSARMEYTNGKYDMGKKVGDWWLNGYRGKLINGLKEGLWITEDGTREEVYSTGELRKSRIYDYESKGLIEETLYNDDGSTSTKEYDLSGRLIYMIKDNGTRVKMDYYENSISNSNYGTIKFDELEYQGELRSYGTVDFSNSYLLEESKNVNAYTAKLYKIKLSDTDLFFFLIKKDGSRYYWVHEIFEGRIIEGKFPNNIIREGRSKIFTRDGNIKETSNYKKNELDGTMLNYSLGKICEEINFNMGKWDGAYKEYDEDGRLIEYLEYEKGRIKE